MTLLEKFLINWVALKTICFREVVRFVRIWSQTLLPSAITMSLYFLIFGKLIGSQLSEIHGYSYMQYIVPGLVMMSIMTNAYANTASSFFQVKFTKAIEEMLVSPMSSIVILLGFTIGGALRGILVGAIVIAIAHLFTNIPVYHPFIMLTMAVLAAFLFSLGGFVNAIFAKRFDDTGFIPTFVLTPLTYLGGVFYSLDALPPSWQTVSLLNPILSIVDTFRFGLLGISDVGVGLGFGIVGFLFIMLFIFAIYLLQRGTGLKA